VTHTTLPSDEVTTRTGPQPAMAVATTASAGLVSARARLTTLRVPSEAVGPGRRCMLVTYSQWWSGDCAIPTG
jgi:hypothetical protein